MAAQKSESYFYDDIWFLAIWCLRGSVIIFCKNSTESCYRARVLSEALGTDKRNTLLGDFLKHRMEIGKTMGRLGLTQ